MQSDIGNNYILVAYHYYANNILTTPLNNITGPCILSVITVIQNNLGKQGLTPKLHIVDNEASEDLKKYFEDSDIQFQMVLPHMHQINATERDVRTFKDHFIATLSTVDHRWELTGNYPVFTVVMVVYHNVERIWRILVTPIFNITYMIINIYYLYEPVNIHILSLINTIQENNWVITTKKP